MQVDNGVDYLVALAWTRDQVDFQLCEHSRSVHQLALQSYGSVVYISPTFYFFIHLRYMSLNHYGHAQMLQ